MTQRLGKSGRFEIGSSIFFHNLRTLGEMSKKKHHQSTEQSQVGDPKPDQKNSEKAPPKKSIGTFLKNEREKRGLSYTQVSDLTKLRPAIVEDLENESWDNLPSPAFASGFVRSYGRVLGLEEKKVMALYQESAPVKVSAPKPLSTPAKSKKVPFFIVVFILLSLSSGYFLWKGYMIKQYVSSMPAEVIAENPSSKKPNMNRESQNTIKEQPNKQDQIDSIPELSNETNEIDKTKDRPGFINNSNEIKTSESSPDQKTPHEDDILSVTSIENVAPELTLRANIREETWIKIYIDDKEPKEYIFRPGRSYKWKAKNGFEILIGNAGGIDLELDGKEVKNPGTVGQVIRLRIPNGYKRMR